MKLSESLTDRLAALRSSSDCDPAALARAEALLAELPDGTPEPEVADGDPISIGAIRLRWAQNDRELDAYISASSYVEACWRQGPNAAEADWESEGPASMAIVAELARWVKFGGPPS